MQYYKLEYEPVDEQGNAVAVSQRQTAVCAKTDYLKKTQVSVSLMSFVLYLWIGLKDPVYRIANALYEYGVNLSKQQIYKDINITACLLMPIFKHMESYIRLEKQIGIDETYHSTRERRLLTKSPPDDRTKSKKHKSQKSKAKTLRTYFYAVIGGKYVCLYYHDPYRDSDIPKEILKKNGLAEDAFVTSDGFYKVLFNLENAEGDEAKELFQHGICWIHYPNVFIILKEFCNWLKIAVFFLFYSNNSNPLLNLKIGVFSYFGGCYYEMFQL
ncbi:IS66 family transposase [Succinivibrio dextrinosolvens]|uniref:IS66 family transposase n=1 Tax=Succinivibrio dextrinosolvens TaxID=83771 RepID=UPI0024119381|nr:transposase [Succinivibrio dextrinosolvens]